METPACAIKHVNNASFGSARCTRKPLQRLCCVAHEKVEAPVQRRAIIATIASTLPLLTSVHYASARNVKEALKAKEERKTKLKAAADAMKETKRSEAAFSDSSYAVSEDKTPNIHTRQEEGARSQENV